MRRVSVGEKANRKLSIKTIKFISGIRFYRFYFPLDPSLRCFLDVQQAIL